MALPSPRCSQPQPGCCLQNWQVTALGSGGVYHFLAMRCMNLPCARATARGGRALPHTELGNEETTKQNHLATEPLPHCKVVQSIHHQQSISILNIHTVYLLSDRYVCITLIREIFTHMKWLLGTLHSLRPLVPPKPSHFFLFQKHFVTHSC